jgi:hypothetical protein
VNRHFVWRAASAPPDDGQEKGKKKASDGRHDVKNPDVFNGPPHYSVDAQEKGQTFGNL